MQHFMYLMLKVALEIQHVDGFLGSGGCLRIKGTVTKTFLHATLTLALTLKRQNL